MSVGRLILLAAVLLLLVSYGAAHNSSQTLTTLYNFQGGSDGQSPIGVVIGTAGVLYGVTGYGGGGPCHLGQDQGCGTFFSLTPPSSPGGPWSEAVLHIFTSPADGVIPSGGLLHYGGSFYGTTTGGGTSNDGTVFRLTPPSSPGGAWSETVLYSFAGGNDGTQPSGGVVVGSGPGGLPVLYGTTRLGGDGGACSGGCGTVFSLMPPSSLGAPWTHAVLYSFQGGSDGSAPATGVVIGSSGVLYGATLFGGSLANGAVFSLAPPASPSSPWTESILGSFETLDCNVVIGKGGVLYGAADFGGTYNEGEVFSLTPPGFPSGTWTEAVLYSSHRSIGLSSLLYNGRSGALFGTTIYGGNHGRGTVYTLRPPTVPGGEWTYALLHAFNGNDGTDPYGLAIGSGGVIYGTTAYGGTAQSGTVFALKP